MAAASVVPLPYGLDEHCPVPWNETAETQLHHDFPFLNQEYTHESFVIRRYLETLWLPESFNPLSQLVSSLLRIVPSVEEDSSRPHPLHFLLEPLLLSTRAASDKYRTNLVEILTDGGGAGEQEEMMMWYAYEYEKAEQEGEGEVDEERWRKIWLERLERRETMIQILLNLIKLSLPGPKPQSPQDSPRKKKKKNGKHDLPPETDEGRLEGYMDKIAMWQLTSSLDERGSSQGKTKAERHWTLVFCEDVVELLFKATLPEECALLRSKVFPESPFSDAGDSDVESVLDGRNSRAASRAPSVSQGHRALSRAPSVTASSGAGRELERSRSRSLSVSLAQDEASQRASFIGQKRALSREFSMSRVFKEKPKARTQTRVKELRSKEVKPVSKEVKAKQGVTLVKETPTKRSRVDAFNQDLRFGDSWSQHFASAASSVPSPPPTSSSDPADMFIVDTPVAIRQRQTPGDETLLPLSPMVIDMSDALARPVTKATKTHSRKNTAPGKSRSARPSQRSMLKIEAISTLDETVDESFMDSFGAPNDMLLNGANGRGKRFGVGSQRKLVRMDDPVDFDMETPTKMRIRKE